MAGQDESVLPAWGGDALSKSLADAQFNERATTVNMPEAYALLKDVNTVFKNVNEAVVHDGDPNRLISRVLLVRSHSSFIASARLAMSGQTFEAYLLFRASIEQAWYALHMAKKPSSAEVWLNRNDDKTSEGQSKNEFSIKSVYATHDSLDPDTAGKLKYIYNYAIDMGGHPNQRGVMTSLRLEPADDSDSSTFSVGILQPEPLRLELALKICVEVAVGVMKTFGLIYPERFKLADLDRQIAAIVTKLGRYTRQQTAKRQSAA